MTHGWCTAEGSTLTQSQTWAKSSAVDAAADWRAERCTRDRSLGIAALDCTWQQKYTLFLSTEVMMMVWLREKTLVCFWGSENDQVRLGPDVSIHPMRCVFNCFHVIPGCDECWRQWKSVILKMSPNQKFRMKRTDARN